YTQGELLAVLQMRTAHDASLKLADQLIAAKLNIASGSDPTTIGTTVADADRLLALFAGKLPYGVAQSSVQGQAMVSDGKLLRRSHSGRPPPPCARSLPWAAAAVWITSRPDRSPDDPIGGPRCVHRRSGYSRAVSRCCHWQRARCARLHRRRRQRSRSVSII